MVPFEPEGRPAPASPSAQLGETVSRLTRGWMRWTKEEARDLGLSLPQIVLIGGLRERGPVPVTHWVEMLGSSPSATTGLLDGLESAGYVVRSHDPADRRQVLVALTGKGTRLADRLRTKFHQRWIALCKGIPATEVREADATLRRLVDRMAAEAPVLAIPPRPRSARRVAA